MLLQNLKGVSEMREVSKTKLLFPYCETLVLLASLLGLFKPEQQGRAPSAPEGGE